jgi:hypothetical protein
MRLLALLIGLATVMALVFFGLSVLLINIVRWLWPAKSKSQLDRVVIYRWPETNEKTKGR